MLPTLDSLRMLGVSGSHLAEGMEGICQASPHLQSLVVNTCEWVDDLRPLVDLHLTGLYIGECRHVEDFTPLNSLTELRILNLSGSLIEDLAPLRNLSGLTTLWLNDCNALTDLQPLASLSKLRELHLRRAADGLDLAPLAGNRKLTVYIDRDQDVQGAETLGRRLHVSWRDPYPASSHSRGPESSAWAADRPQLLPCRCSRSCGTYARSHG
ncbi:leucine-rich repeat domain-containing protein [Actinomadura sp. 7K507]|uniref:leucine-rich repeat domain-containing protein n=1 Tax=Actinomadura sp. 7K507 TaxID=2530365 RepID=UPI001042B1D1|nr:leucine-rich repeat domain-containing protein [Actinomadura sp. 7K507]TDC94957.1 hypothetical protein E1285_07760 [Actinomadura sp. 7K507]